jgi:hypothetical protein
MGAMVRIVTEKIALAFAGSSGLAALYKFVNQPPHFFGVCSKCTMQGITRAIGA